MYQHLLTNQIQQWCSITGLKLTSWGLVYVEWNMKTYWQHKAFMDNTTNTYYEYMKTHMHIWTLTLGQTKHLCHFVACPLICSHSEWQSHAHSRGTGSHTHDAQNMVMCAVSTESWILNPESYSILSLTVAFYELGLSEFIYLVLY